MSYRENEPVLTEKQLKQVADEQKKLGFEIVDVLCYDIQPDGSHNFATKAKVQERTPDGRTIERVINRKFNTTILAESNGTEESPVRKVRKGAVRKS